MTERILKPSRFTLGTVQLGVNYGMANATGKPSQETAFAILDEARANGVLSLDTAAAYGTSEEVVGSWLKERRLPTYVVSKFKLKTDDPLTELETQIRNSEARLGTVSGYMFHDADQMRKYAELVRPRLERMQEEDRMCFIGSSVYTVEDVESFLEIGWLKAIQIPMSILDTRIVQRGLLAELQKRGVTVFVRSVFLQGMVCMPEPPEKYAFMAPSVKALREIADAEGMSLMQMAVSYIRDLPGVDSLVLGCERPEQVKANAALIGGPSISASGLAQIEALAPSIPIEHCMQVILGKA